MGFVHFGGFSAPLDLEPEYVVVDVETTGFDPAHDRVLEVAALRTRGDGTVTAQFSTLLHPEVPDTGAPHVHGITMDMISAAPTFAQVWPALSALFAGAAFVAHNAAFDVGFLAAETARVGVEVPMQPGLCTLWLSRQALPHLDSHRLASVQAELGLSAVKAHAAAADALVVLQALPRLLAQVPPMRHYVPHTPRATVVPQVPALSR